MTIRTFLMAFVGIGMGISSALIAGGAYDCGFEVGKADNQDQKKEETHKETEEK